MRTPPLVPFLLSSLLAWGCTDLPAIALGTCGNGVVEAASGEDCDGFAPEGSRCEQPGETNECRFSCEAARCPTGYGCGKDGLCRKPSGGFGAAALTFTDQPVDMALVDGDGDGRADLWSAGERRVSIHYGIDSTTPVDQSVASLAALPVAPKIADLSGDGLADALLPATLGYFTALGNPQRRQAVKAYTSLPIPSGVTAVRGIAAEARPDAPGDETLVFALLADVPELFYVDAATGDIEILARLSHSPDDLAADVRVGSLDEDPSSSPCDELVLPFRDAPELEILSLCARTPRGTIELDASRATSTVELPQGSVVSGPVELQDLNHDGHLDLVAVASSGGIQELDVAYGDGNGAFSSRADAPGLSSPDGKASTAVKVGTSVPLTARDIDGDGTPDWVDASGVYLSRGDSPKIVRSNPGAPWTSAVIGPFDGDALEDVAVGSNADSGVEFLINAGSDRFTPYDLPTTGPISALCIGDFDGDRIRDVAVGVSGQESDVLGIAFGQSSGAPSAVKDVGLLYRIHQVARSATATGTPLVVDGPDDLGVFTEDPDGTLGFAVLIGQSDRELRAPYSMARALADDLFVEFYLPFRFVKTDIEGDGSPDVVVLAARYDRPEIRWWSTPLYGAASIRLAAAGPSEPLPDDLDWTRADVASLDLDDSPGEEIVVLGPLSDGSGAGMSISRRVPSRERIPSFVTDAAIPIEGTFERTETVAAGRDGYNGRLRVADVDADGASDVLALVKRNGRGELAVFFNDHEGELGQAGRVSGAEDLDVRDFAIVGERSGSTAVALLATDGVYLVDVDGQSRTLTARSAPALSNPGAFVLSTGDVDGDGLDDVALEDEDGVTVHYGLSLLR